MTFLATYWYMFMLLTFILWGLAVAFQLRNMQGIGKIPLDMLKSLDTEDDEEVKSMQEMIGGAVNNGFSGFFNGMIPVLLFGLLGMASGILFLIGVVVAIIQYAS
jgi:hypothetical protein